MILVSPKVKKGQLETQSASLRPQSVLAGIVAAMAAVVMTVLDCWLPLKAIYTGQFLCIVLWEYSTTHHFSNIRKNNHGCYHHY